MPRSIADRTIGAFCCQMKLWGTRRFEDSSHPLTSRTFGPTEDRLLRQPPFWEPDACLSLIFLPGAVCRWEMPMDTYGSRITARFTITESYEPSLRAEDTDSIPTAT